MAQPQDHVLSPDAPRPAEGIDLIGEYRDSGLEEVPYLARRADGQVVQLSRLLYLVAEAADGHRDFGQIAERVGPQFGRRVTADNVRFLVEQQLRPLGVLAAAEGEAVELRRLDPGLLGLRYRLPLVPANVASLATIPFLPLFRLPVVVAVLGALAAVDVWLLLFHGVLEGMREFIYQPSLVLAFFGVELVAMAWHECGHATACRYGGAKPGVVGVGIYIIWFVFYSDVTDSYRLDRLGRVRTDLGGVYFDAIFTLALAGAYFLTGFEPLLVLVLFNQLDTLDEFSPFLRFDGYYVVSDLTGLPDLFEYITATLKSLIPGREAEEKVKRLKPWVRAVLTLWVLSVVPAFAVGLAVLVIYGPFFVSTAWGSFLVQYGELSGAIRDGRAVDGLLALIDAGILAVPVVGGALIGGLVLVRASAAVWRRTEGRRLLRAGVVAVVLAAVLVAVAAGLLLLRGADLG